MIHSCGLCSKVNLVLVLVGFQDSNRMGVRTMVMDLGSWLVSCYRRLCCPLDYNPGILASLCLHLLSTVLTVCYLTNILPGSLEDRIVGLFRLKMFGDGVLQGGKPSQKQENLARVFDLLMELIRWQWRFHLISKLSFYLLHCVS